MVPGTDKENLFVPGAIFLLGQGPVLRVEFFVFRKMECVKQINHLLCRWLKMLKLTVKKPPVIKL